MKVVVSYTKAGAQVISFNAPANQIDVFNVLRDLVSQDAKSSNKRIIYVITGTHGNFDGTVDQTIRDVSFKDEDLDSARITRNSINIRDYHETAPLRWKELSDKGKNVVHILAWCYSNQWTTNTTANGNNGKLVMK